MNYWLIKSEPFVYSWDAFVNDGKTAWEGVRNYAARNFLRNMKKGDLALYYHSNEGLEVVGIAKVIREAYPDPTGEGDTWSAVDFKAHKKLRNPVSLAHIKNDPLLSEIALIRQSRLSVMPLKPEEFDRIIEVSETRLS